MHIIYFILGKDFEFVYFEIDQIAILKIDDDSFMIVRSEMEEFARIQDTIRIWDDKDLKEEHERANEIFLTLRQLPNGLVKNIQDRRTIKNFMLSLATPAI